MLVKCHEGASKIALHNKIVYRKLFGTVKKVRDGSKFIGYPGRDHRQGGEDFFSKKKGGADFFSKKIRGRRLFFEKY